MVVPFSGKKGEEEKVGTRHFATINVKDVSEFAPPPKRVGNLPGARPEAARTPPVSAEPGDEEEEDVRGRSNSSSRPAPPLPTRSQTSVSTVTSLE